METLHRRLLRWVCRAGGYCDEDVVQMSCRWVSRDVLALNRPWNAIKLNQCLTTLRRTSADGRHAWVRSRRFNKSEKSMRSRGYRSYMGVQLQVVCATFVFTYFLSSLLVYRFAIVKLLPMWRIYFFFWFEITGASGNVSQFFLFNSFNKSLNWYLLRVALRVYQRWYKPVWYIYLTQQLWRAFVHRDMPAAAVRSMLGTAADCTICLDVFATFIWFAVIAVEEVQSSGAHDVQRQETTSSHLPDEYLRTGPTSSSLDIVLVLVLCVDDEEVKKA